MDAPLILAGLAMGVAASPHCAVMCGAPCAALTSRSKHSAAGFQIGRLIGYMAAGAVAASSVVFLGTWSQTAPALRPLWAVLHLAFLTLGVWWLVTGRQPHWMKRGGAVPVVLPMTLRTVSPSPLPGAAPMAFSGPLPTARQSILPTAWRLAVPRQSGNVHGQPMRAAAAGLAWVAWPCGALQAGLLLSALANSATSGALVMAGFAIGSAPALAAGPWLWARWQALRGSTVSSAQVAVLGFRVAGGSLVLASGWALTHGLWQRFAAWCLA